MPRASVDLIPWDGESPEHVERLTEQRIQCGWDKDKVEVVWRQAQKEGTSCIYWIVLRSDDAEYVSGLLAEQAARYPQDATPLRDTAASIRAVPRTPTGEAFRPVGHITIQDSQPAIQAHGIDVPATDALWIKSLYISHPLHSAGVGGAALDAIERLASEPPLSARYLLVDTLHREDHLSAAATRAYFAGSAPRMANHDWCLRRGYRLIGEIVNFYGDRDPSTGEAWRMRTVVLRRDLVSRL